MEKRRHILCAANVKFLPLLALSKKLQPSCDFCDDGKRSWGKKLLLRKQEEEPFLLHSVLWTQPGPCSHCPPFDINRATDDRPQKSSGFVESRRRTRLHTLGTHTDTRMGESVLRQEWPYLRKKEGVCRPRTGTSVRNCFRCTRLIHGA